MLKLRATERQLTTDPDCPTAYFKEIDKLLQADAVKEISANKLAEQGESRFIPHNMVQHNGEKALCSNAPFSSMTYCLDPLWEPLSWVSY